MTPSPDIAIPASGAKMRTITPKVNGHDTSHEQRRARPLALLDPRAWTKPAPPREWIVQDWIPRGVVTALYGDGGVGKSLLAQMLLSCAALGAPWVGLQSVRGRALGVFCEDDDAELQRRQEAINQALGATMQDLGDLRLMSRLGEENVLMDFSASDAGVLTDFFHDLDATIGRFQPALVSLDTAADLFGGNENIRPQVRRFVGTCLGKLARKHDCGLLLLAHPSSAGLRDGSGSGGSTAWNNTVRSRLYLTRQGGEDEAEDTNRRTLSRKKANYAAQHGGVEMEWHAGAFRMMQAGSSSMDDPATWQAIGLMFDELERAWKEGPPWSPAAQTRASGRYFPAWAKARLGVPERRTADLLTGWMMSGCLRVEVFDSDAKTKGLRVVRRPDQ